MANKTIKIGKSVIGEDNPIYFIAEIGINHNGDMQIAKKLIDGAFACNWHCVKFQKRTPDDCVPEEQKNILKETPWGKMTYLDYKKRIEFETNEYNYIENYCAMKPIDWSASPWDLKSLNFLLDYDLPFIKIASAMLTNDELLIAAAKSKVPVFLSTGMSTLDEIDHAVEILEKYSDGDYVLFHTNSAYPSPEKELNLKVIKTLKERYNCIVGYSGHEFGLEASMLAVSLGASVIERHITLDHRLWGSDQASSLEMKGMDFLYKRTENISIMMGSDKKVVTESELSARKKLRGN